MSSPKTSSKPTWDASVWGLMAVLCGVLFLDGLAARGLCTEDRRGIHVCITDAGRDRWEAARPAHRAALAESLG